MSYVDAPGSPGIRVINPADGRMFKGRFHGNVYKVEPGGEVYAPWDAAVLWLGNPALVDEGTNKRRRDEFNRICVKYGVYENSHLLDQQGPTIKIFTLDGQPIDMLLDDIDGENVTPDIQTRRENLDMAERLEKMERETALLRKRLERRGDEVGVEAEADGPPKTASSHTEPRVGTLGPDEDEEAVEDTPNRVPVGGS